MPVLFGDLKSSTEVVCKLLEETIQTFAMTAKQSVAVDVGSQHNTMERPHGQGKKYSN
jgi:hypothetical protein